MDDAWVCGDCKSINRARERRCYKCHGERADALASTGSERRTVEAVVSRRVRDYLPTWPLAILAGGLLVAVTAFGVLLLLRSAQDVPALRDAFVAQAYGGGFETDRLVTQSAETALLGLVRFGLVLLALVSFAAWLALATMNVPTLGGGVPSRSPLRVFAYTLIPLWNLFKVPGMVQDVLYRLDPSAGGAWMVMAATIGLLGSWFVAYFSNWVIAAAAVRDVFEATSREQVAAVFGRIVDQTFWLSVVTELMVAVGTLLVVALMVRVEQRCAARNKEIQVALDMLAAGPALADSPPGALPSIAPPPVAPVAPAPANPPASPPEPRLATVPHSFQVAGRSPSDTVSSPPPPPPPA